MKSLKKHICAAIAAGLVFGVACGGISEATSIGIPVDENGLPVDVSLIEVPLKPPISNAMSGEKDPYMFVINSDCPKDGIDGDKLVGASKCACGYAIGGNQDSGANPFCDYYTSPSDSVDKDMAMYYIGQKYPSFLLNLGTDAQVQKYYYKMKETMSNQKMYQKYSEYVDRMNGTSISTMSDDPGKKTVVTEIEDGAKENKPNDGRNDPVVPPTSAKHDGENKLEQADKEEKKNSQPKIKKYTGAQLVSLIKKSVKDGNCHIGKNKLNDAMDCICGWGAGADTKTGSNAFCDATSNNEKEMALYYIGKKYPEILKNYGTEAQGKKYTNTPTTQKFENYSADMEGRKAKDMKAEQKKDIKAEQKKKKLKKAAAAVAAAAAAVAAATAAWKAYQKKRRRVKYGRTAQASKLQKQLQNAKATLAKKKKELEKLKKSK